MHEECWLEKHIDIPDHEFQSKTKNHEMVSLSVSDVLAQYKTNGRVVVTGQSLATALASCCDDVLMQGSGMSGGTVAFAGVANAVIFAVEVGFRWNELAEGKISPKVFKIKVSGAAGAAVGGFTGGLAGAGYGGLTAGLPGAIVGGLIGSVGVGFAGRIGAETVALKYFGNEDTEMLIQMLFQSLERMDLVGGLDAREMTQEDVVMAYRNLSRLKHPDKVKRLPSHTDAQHAQRVADATTKFGILIADTFLVCEWIKARDEQKDLWTDENLRQIHKKQEDWRKSHESLHQQLASQQEESARQMRDGRKI